MDTVRFMFFDVDETLIHMKSMFAFFRHWALQVKKDPTLLAHFETRFAELRQAGTPRSELNRVYYQFFKGENPSELTKSGRQWMLALLEDPDAFFIGETLEVLRQYQAIGYEAVFVSGSFREILKPLADYLRVEHMLCINLEINETGVYTGEFSGIQTIAEGKALAIKEFLKNKNADLKQCLAFGDDMSDLPMLELVGNPVVVGTHTLLAERGEHMGWRILSAG